MNPSAIAGLATIIAIFVGIFLLDRKLDLDAKAYIEQWAKTKNYTVVSIHNRVFELDKMTLTKSKAQRLYSVEVQTHGGQTRYATIKYGDYFLGGLVKTIEVKWSNEDYA